MSLDRRSRGSDVRPLLILTHALDDESFHRTCVGRMRDVTADSFPVTDIWPYVEAIPKREFRTAHYRFEEVELVYRSADDRFDHVLVPTTGRNVDLAVVVDRTAASVFGHHLLDLNEKYGLKRDP